MNVIGAISFEQPNILAAMDGLTVEEMDDLDFGVIGFDADGLVRRYSRFESRMAGLSIERVVGTSLFMSVAPCMNNYLVAQRFEDSAVDGSPLDAIIDYVFTLRMRPVKVKLRLVAAPGAALRYVLVKRSS